MATFQTREEKRGETTLYDYVFLIMRYYYIQDKLGELAM